MKIPLTSSMFLFTICIYSCINIAGECETKETERLPNKPGNLQAVKVRNDCGATTTPSSFLRIVESSDTTNIGEPENSVLEKVAQVELYWKSNDTLVISKIDTFHRDLKENVYNLKKSSGRVVIEYKH